VRAEVPAEKEITMHKLLYRSFDPLNSADAETLAREAGFECEVVEPRDRVPFGDQHPDVIDLDFWVLEPRELDQLIDTLSTTRFPAPVAVHGYCLSDEQAAALRRNGVLVYARLEPKVFSDLAALLPKAPAPVPAVQPKPPVAAAAASAGRGSEQIRNTESGMERG